MYAYPFLSFSLSLSSTQVRVSLLRPADRFVVLATDGVWDVVRSNAEAVAIVQVCARRASILDAPSATSAVPPSSVEDTDAASCGCCCALISTRGRTLTSAPCVTSRCVTCPPPLLCLARARREHQGIPRGVSRGRGCARRSGGGARRRRARGCRVPGARGGEARTGHVVPLRQRHRRRTRARLHRRISFVRVPVSC